MDGLEHAQAEEGGMTARKDTLEVTDMTGRCWR